MEQDFSEYVHKLGKRWVVARYRDGRYYAPHPPDVRKLTGCHTAVGSLSSVARNAYIYTRRSRALARARELYG